MERCCRNVTKRIEDFYIIIFQPGRHLSKALSRLFVLLSTFFRKMLEKIRQTAAKLEASHMTDFAATWQIIRVKSTDLILNRSNFSGVKAWPGTAWNF